MRRGWLAAVVAACVFPQSGPQSGPQPAPSPPPASPDRAAADLAAKYDILLDRVAEADREVAAHRDEQASTSYRAAAGAVDHLLAWFGDSTNHFGRGPGVEYHTSHDGALDEAHLIANLRAVRQRAQREAEEASDRIVAELERRYAAKTPGQRAVLIQHGAPDVSHVRGQTCWIYRSDQVEDTFCWTDAGKLVSHKTVVPSTGEPLASDPADPPVTSSTPHGNAKPAIAYYAAATFASGSCEFSDCLKDGWSTGTPAGTVRSRCNFSDCSKDGWTSDHPDGTRSETRCHFSKCFEDGWTTTHPDGTSSETRCAFSDCMKDGWTTTMPDGSTATTRCSFSKCTTDGWTTELPGGRSVTCRCNFSDCLKNGATCG